MDNSSKIPIATSFSILLCCISLLFILASNDHPYESLNGVYAYAQQEGNVNDSKTKLVYHLSSDHPWRVTIALLDSQTMLSMGYNVTLMLSIEGVQLGVKNPHYF